MQQYEENPYPRWTLKPLPAASGARDMLKAASGSPAQRAPRDILIAGCGTGQHVFTISRLFPEAQLLAVDISLASVAFARRKTREEGLRNVEYAQANILRLDTIGRSFDRIEAIGVLHHLADPIAGWRILLNLLRPEGVMRVGLYSKLARRAVAEGRALIAEHRFRAVAEDIRKCREQILRGNQERWADLTGTIDFYTMSGCRDLLFNVMEHRFTITGLKIFLREHGLSFLGFELKPEIIDMFQRQFPDADALNNLDHWHEFESVHPQTFLQMYVFSVCKAPPVPKARPPN
jgi:SAM-dependent methyltransferase